MIRVVVDAMGGDFAPEITVRGSLEALRAFADVHITLVGKGEALQPFLQDAGEAMARITLVEAADVITNHEPPALAIRRKVESSLVKAFTLLREGQGDALVSAGSTGAVMAGGMFRLGRIEGVERPPLATLMPGVDQPALLLDIGANVDCQPEWLVQFALMGSVYMQKVVGRAKPRVALLGIGEEDEKGNQLTKAACMLLRKPQPFLFTGNLEPRGIPMGEADVVVADGFHGNLVMKAMEGITGAMFKLIKRELMSTTRGKLGALLAKPAFTQIRQAVSAEEIGGAVLLGLQNTVVKAHGNSNAHAFASAIAQARKAVQGDVVNVIRRDMAQLA